jgi:molybdopterin synthase sulfur carrier subunit
MTAHILAFGIVKEIFGAAAIDHALDEGATVSDLTSTLEERFPKLKQLASYRVALNSEFASGEQPLQDCDEIAIIPPVSGG